MEDIMNTIEQKDNGVLEVIIRVKPGEALCLPVGTYRVIGDITATKTEHLSLGGSLIRGEAKQPKVTFPETIKCFKCNHDMTKGQRHWGESSNIWPIGQIYHCNFCRESVGITQDGRITYWTGKVIGHLVVDSVARYHDCPLTKT